ncbi:MAG TPA: ABC transporter ATP-binding protein, partial [Thermoanaerobaculia bacterium]|nr:ABC transporter ATP-binding protein [Thermoanaerobaculia bacterium]
MSVLALRGVSHRYAGAARDAVATASLTVEAGSLVGVVGPNGSGKSTLMKLIARILAPDSGEIL